jgi:hypothetical protein
MFLMVLRSTLAVLAWSVVALLGATGSFAQSGSSSAASTGTSSGYLRTSGRDNPALRYFTRSQAHFATTQMAGRPSLPAAPRPTVSARSKPFSSIPAGPTVSPYLALDLQENGVGLPNYYAFVRPQLEQEQQRQVQQVQYQRIQQQFNAASGSPAFSNGGLPTTGHSTQFMNPGGYFRNLR